MSKRMTKPSSKYSWQAVRTLNAQEERLAQEQLAAAEAELGLVMATVERAQAAAARWQEVGEQTVRALSKSDVKPMYSVTELQSLATYNCRCFATRDKYRVQMRIAQKQAQHIAGQIEDLREALRTAHGKRSATDQHYNRWAQQVRRSSELSAELEQEDQFLAQRNLRASGPMKR